MKIYLFKILTRRDIRALSLVIITIFISEILSHYLIETIAPDHKFIQSVLDAFLLILILFPILYLTGYKPFNKSLQKNNFLKKINNSTRITYESLINSINDIVFVVDKDGKILTGNNYFFNFNAAYIIDPPLKKGDYFIHKLTASDEIKKSWAVHFDRALHNETFEIENNITDKNRWVETKFAPIKIDEEIIGISVFSKDITRRKKDELKLKENLDLLSTAQSIAFLGSYICDLKSGLFISNSIFDTITGIDNSFIKNLTNYRNIIVAPEFRESSVLIFENCIKYKTYQYTNQYKIIRLSDNSERWVKVNGKFELDAEGEPLKFIAAIMDITEYMYLIRQKEIIIESISNYFYSVNKYSNITYFNKAFFDVYKYKKGAVNFYEKNIFEIFPEYKNTIFEENLLVAMATNTPVDFEIYNSKTKNWKEYHFYPHEEGCSIMFNYINDRIIGKEKLLKANQTLRLKTEELLNTNAELERFSYVASHDLQEPLRMVSNFLELLALRYNDVIDEKGKLYIHYAVDGAKRMQQLIKDLLQFSRVGSGTLEITKVDMNEVMNNVIQLYNNDFTYGSAEITVEKLPEIDAVKLPMIQLMQNLVGNALKYRNPEKTIIQVTAEESEYEWLFSVKDNGIGIDPVYFEKIFIIFQRLHNKDDYSGTGIGLSICKKIVERFNGKIWVESALNKGATFKFTIPKNKNTTE